MARDDDAEVELPRAVALAWGVAANPQRGPKREMSVERIVEAAVGIADAEGLAAVSMARVASALGYTPMSLYRYVTAKDDLVALMQEAGTGLPPEPGDEVVGWRARLTFWAHAQLANYFAHPWLLDIPIDGTPITPNNVAWMDAGLTALEPLPLTEEERVAVMLLVTGQVRWQGIVLRGYLDAAVDGDTQAIDDERSAILDHLVTADEFPAVRRAVDAGVYRSGADPFAFGLERILDGVDAFLARTPDRPGAEPVAADPEPDAAVLADRRVRETQRARREAEKLLRLRRKEERAAIREAAARQGA